MSSIYKKGRDGYYYYQTYIHNPKTGKKNKRIFHALRTKDVEIAKKKQLELDRDYAKLKKNKYNKVSNVVKKYFIKMLIFIFFLIFIKTMLNNFDLKSKLLQESQIESQKVDFEKEKNDIITDKDSNNSFETNQININDVILSKNQPIIPQFTVHRIDEHSSSFNQASIYATVKGAYNDEGLKILNRKIVKKYPAFSNFIICLYLENELGLSLAKGIINQILIEDKTKVWLSMYSINQIEGEYFDASPNSYYGETK